MALAEILWPLVNGLQSDEPSVELEICPTEAVELNKILYVNIFFSVIASC